MRAMLGFSRPRIAAVAAALAALATFAGCGTERTPAGRTLALSECRLARLASAAQCGALEVPEDRSKPEGRKITIAVAILPANTLNPAPDPMIIVAGGPGQSATSLGPFAALFTSVRRNRDIVLVDQRGTGRSSPLECEAFKPSDKLETNLELDPVARATECARELKAKGIDTAQYTTAAWIADLDAVREALGYERVNLWGGSYGTRASLEYARRFPQRVRSMVLDGVAPPSLKVALDVFPTREAAIVATFAACQESPSCRQGHGDFKAELAAIETRLGAEGADVAFEDPRTGSKHTLHLTLTHVLAASQPLVYLPEFAALLPELYHRAAASDFGPLIAAASALSSGLAEQLNSALYYSVTCAEDVSRIAPGERDSKLAGVRARVLAERGIAVCDVWAAGRPAPGSDAPVVSDIPTLLLSGGLDPVTPPRYAEEVAKTLRNSRHIVAKGYGHNVSPHSCMPRVIAAFIEDAGFANLPATCIKEIEASGRPPFWTDNLGAKP